MKRAYLIVGLALLLAAAPATAQVINEILYDTIAATDAGTFTEILGPPGLSLDGYVLAGVNGNGGAVYRTVDLTGNSIPGDGYFVIAQDATTPEWDYIDPDVDWQNGPDQVQLWLVSGEGAQADTIIIDSICYGGSGDLNCEGGTNGPNVGPDNSISRCPDGQDTNNNGDDTAETPSTPGVENLCIIIEPIELTTCQMMELDEDGFPVYFGELVHLIDPVTTLMDNLTYHPERFEVAVTGECCTHLFDQSIENLPMPAGTILDVTGNVGFFNGKTQLTNLEFVVLGNEDVPEPFQVTTGELTADGETYESCLIEICGLEIVEGTWPEAGSANLVVDDGSGPTVLRIDSDTDIPGSPAPVQPFTAIGIGGQFDGDSPYFDGYQFLPRNLEDILSGVDCEPTATEKSTWGQIKSRYTD